MTFVSLCRQTRLCRHTITNLLEKKNKQDKQGMMSRLKVECFKSLTSVTKPVSLKGISPQVRCLTSSSLADCEGQAMYLGDLPAPTIPAQRTSTLLTALSRPSPWSRGVRTSVARGSLPSQKMSKSLSRSRLSGQRSRPSRTRRPRMNGNQEGCFQGILVRAFLARHEVISAIVLCLCIILGNKYQVQVMIIFENN